MKFVIQLLPLLCTSAVLAGPISGSPRQRDLNRRGWQDEDFAHQLGNSIFGKNPDDHPYEAIFGGHQEDEYLRERRKQFEEDRKNEEDQRVQDEWNANSMNRLPKEWSAGTDHVRQMYEKKKWKPNGMDLVKNPLDDEVNNGGAKGKGKEKKKQKGVARKVMGALKKLGN